MCVCRCSRAWRHCRCAEPVHLWSQRQVHAGVYDHVCRCKVGDLQCTWCCAGRPPRVPGIQVPPHRAPPVCRPNTWPARHCGRTCGYYLHGVAHLFQRSALHAACSSSCNELMQQSKFWLSETCAAACASSSPVILTGPLWTVAHPGASITCHLQLVVDLCNLLERSLSSRPPVAGTGMGATGRVSAPRRRRTVCLVAGGWRRRSGRNLPPGTWPE